MSSEYQQAVDFIERVENAAGLEELRLHLAATLENFGVPNFSVVGMVPEHEGQPRVATVLVRRVADDWVDSYWEQRRFNIDPVVHAALQRYSAFSWTEFEHNRQTKEVRDLFAEIREAMPIDGGLAIPTHDDQGFAGLVALYTESKELPQKTRQALKLISIYAVERAKELYALEGVGVAMAGACPLTPRQREVLSWASAGKSDWDISAMLGIAQSTVNEHVEGAKRALGVKTCMQAVAIAIQRGWIVL